MVATTEKQEQNYFIPMLDMMVGILFIFIILLVSTASRYEEKIRQIQGIDKTSKIIVENFCMSLEEENLKLDCDPNAHKVRFEGDSFFNSGEVDLTLQGKENLVKIASIIKTNLLDDVYHLPGSIERKDRAHDGIYINSILLEGHSDEKPLGSNTARLYGSNLNLSAQRANSFYEALDEYFLEDGTKIEEIKNQDCQAVFGISGYGEKRPVPDASNCDLTDDECLSRNRRIELKILSVAEKNVESNCK